MIQAYIALERREKRRALELLQQVQAEDPEAPLLLHYLSQAYVSLHLWDDAEATARKILAGDPTNIQGHLCLGRCLLHANRLPEAVEAALDAISHDFSNPRGHFLLGTALFQSNDWQNAVTALERATQLGRGIDITPAHRMLAVITNRKGDLEASTRHHLQSRAVRQESRSTQETKLARLRTEIADRAATREASRREHRSKAPLPLPIPRESMEFLIVSGLPRSGTSLMMQILTAGGLEAMTDGLREADSDNPEGYYEWEEIKTLPRAPAVIEKAQGKVIKVISALLPHLPPWHRYKIVFMTRPPEQIARSQEIMIQNRGGEITDRHRMEETLREHAVQVLEELRSQPNVELLEMSYPDLIADPDSALRPLATFVGGDFRPSATAKSAIRPALFRNS